MKIKRPQAEPIIAFKDAHRFLSNFYPCVILLEGITYPTAEHAYQAQKTTIEMQRELIAKMISPGKAKRAGRHLPLRSGWDSMKLEVMEQILCKKFTHADLMDRLQATGNAELIEGNTWNDTFWGMCRVNGLGQNHLGKLLMKIRKDANEDQASPTN